MATYRLVRTAPPPAVAPVLDASQQAVVDHRGGPLLVLAGPGTGKTTTLVEAVVERVRRGASPEQVLALTFSRRAADELRARITTRLGRTVREPSAFTFHSFAYALVRAYGHGVGDEPVRLLSGPERDVRIRELIGGHAEGVGTTRWPAELAGALRLRGFAGEVADLLDRARERGLDGAGLRRLGERTGRAGWVSAGHFLDEYLDVLGLRGELDYAGVVHAALDLLAEPQVAAAVTGRYVAVFVDEYQDLDPAQEDLVRALAGGGRYLVAVGDPDQSIYAFRGAEPSCLLEFPQRFRTAAGRDAPVVSLGVCRRAGAALLAPSRALARRIPTPGLPVALRERHRELAPAGAATATPPEIRLYPTVADEVTAIADLLRRAHLQDGLPWSQMAVLVRSGVRSMPVLRRAFVTAGVPVSVAADEVPVARDPAVAPLLAALRVAAWRAGGPAERGADPLTVESARLLLLSPLARAQPTLLRALGRRLRALDRAAGAEFAAPSMALIRDAVRDPRELALVEDRLAAPVRRLHAALAAAAEVLRERGSPEQALWALWDGSGWGRRLAADSFAGGAAGRAADRDLDAVLALFDAAARLEQRRPHAGITALFDDLAAQQIPAAPNDERAAAADAVRLLTAHRAKGLEWDLVVVAGVQEGGWPDLRRRGSLLEADLVGVGGELRAPPSTATLLAEERRLFYVALTRARRRLVLTAVSSLDDSGERPSRLLAETGLSVPASVLAGTQLLAPASLVGRLRRALTDGAASDALRAAAARELARLADLAGPDGGALVPAADPARWWGIAPVSGGAHPVRDPDVPVRLSASALSAYLTCPLRAFLGREARAGGAATAAQGFGRALHALAQLVGEGALPADVDALDARLDAVWPALGHEAAWYAAGERAAARAALARLVGWLVADSRALVAAEATFELTIGDAKIGGRLDRLERDEHGRLYVVDVKTGRRAGRGEDIEANPQLGVYQRAVRGGGVVDVPPGEPGGAELVWLRDGHADGRAKVARQAALGADDDRFDTLIAAVAEALRAEAFPARPNAGCERCEFRPACPAHDSGRPVVE